MTWVLDASAALGLALGDGDEANGVEESDAAVPICACAPEATQRNDRKRKLAWLTMDSGCGKSCCSKKLAERNAVVP